uniref:Uncharacterized protein n=1 Tax=Ascaris lumbricoides TaxID=6252 RepID=A0A0M3HKB7_ASCLU
MGQRIHRRRRHGRRLWIRNRRLASHTTSQQRLTDGISSKS